MRADLEYITGVLDEIESLLQDGSRVPMNRGRVMVDRSEVLVLARELRDSLPRELEEAKAIHREHGSIISSAREEAERIVQNARQSSQELVAETDSYRRAQRLARENLEGAERYSREVSRGAESYREQVMARTEHWFEEALDSISQSRQDLEQPPEGPASAVGEEEGEGPQASSA